MIAVRVVDHGMTYDSVRRMAGEVIDMPDDDARVLMAIGKVAEVEAKPSRGRYVRRDLRAKE